MDTQNASKGQNSLPLSIRGLGAQTNAPVKSDQLPSEMYSLLNNTSQQHLQQILPFTLSLNLEYLRYQTRRGEPVNRLYFLPMSRELGKPPTLRYAWFETDSESEWFQQHGTTLLMRESDDAVEPAEDWLLWKVTFGMETLELRYYQPETDCLGAIRLREPHDLHCQVQHVYAGSKLPDRKVYFDVSKHARYGRELRLLDWQEGLPLVSAVFYLDTTTLMMEDWTRDSEEIFQKLRDSRATQEE